MALAVRAASSLPLNRTLNTLLDCRPSAAGLSLRWLNRIVDRDWFSRRFPLPDAKKFTLNIGVRCHYFSDTSLILNCLRLLLGLRGILN